jgi:capsid protein
MVTDPKMVENLVEIITHEVLVAMVEQREKSHAPADGQCTFNCTDGLCVRTWFTAPAKSSAPEPSGSPRPSG